MSMLRINMVLVLFTLMRKLETGVSPEFAGGFHERTALKEVTSVKIRSLGSCGYKSKTEVEKNKATTRLREIGWGVLAVSALAHITL